MSETREQLQRQFRALIAWERRKHFERAALISAGLALASAIVLLPLPAFLPVVGLRWLMPLLLMLLFTPWLTHRWRWRKQDSARALVNLDKTLKLAERATTAWELSAQDSHHAAHELVFKQAYQRLSGFDARRQFPRQWSWETYAAAPLLLLWIALIWFEVDRSLLNQSTGTVSPLVYKLQEFSRDLQAKAKSEGLSESLKAGQELEKIARETLAAKHTDEQLKKELAGTAKQFERDAKSSDPKSFSAGESREALQDLKAELETARDFFNLPDMDKPNQALAQQWLDRLASLPQLKRQLDKENQRSMAGSSAMKSFLDRLNREATGELDRRTLLDAQQFLEQMARSGQNRSSENEFKVAGRGEQEGEGENSREKKSGSLPGRDPGKPDDRLGSLPQFRGGAPTQVKGALSEGDSNAVEFKGKPTPGKSVLGQQEVRAQYRRQAEQELNSERVPEALKETIRNYFLSLENGEPRK